MTKKKVWKSGIKTKCVHVGYLYSKSWLRNYIFRACERREATLSRLPPSPHLTNGNRHRLANLNHKHQAGWNKTLQIMSLSEKSTLSRQGYSHSVIRKTSSLPFWNLSFLLLFESTWAEWGSSSVYVCRWDTRVCSGLGGSGCFLMEAERQMVSSCKEENGEERRVRVITQKMPSCSHHFPSESDPVLLFGD